jgi:hypothetical protein
MPRKLFLLLIIILVFCTSTVLAFDLSVTSSAGSGTWSNGRYLVAIGSTVNFSVTPNGGNAPYSFCWDFSTPPNSSKLGEWDHDNLALCYSTQQNPSHTFDSYGEYEVWVHVKDSSNNPITKRAVLLVSVEFNGIEYLATDSSNGPGLDNSGSVDNSGAFNTWIQQQSGNGTLSFPSGAYVFNEGIYLRGFDTIELKPEPGATVKLIFRPNNFGDGRWNKFINAAQVSQLIYIHDLILERDLEGFLLSEMDRTQAISYGHQTIQNCTFKNFTVNVDTLKNATITKTNFLNWGNGDDTGGELLSNGNMESIAEWYDYNTPITNKRSNGEVFSGGYSREFIADSAEDGIRSSDFITQASEHYAVKFYVYPINSKEINVKVRGGDNSGWVYEIAYSDLIMNSWNQIVFAYRENHSGGPNAYLAICDPSGLNNSFYVDEANIWHIHDHSSLQGADGFILLDRVYSTPNSILNGHNFYQGGGESAYMYFRGGYFDGRNEIRGNNLDLRTGAINKYFYRNWIRTSNSTDDNPINLVGEKKVEIIDNVFDPSGPNKWESPNSIVKYNRFYNQTSGTHCLYAGGGTIIENNIFGIGVPAGGVYKIYSFDGLSGCGSCDGIFTDIANPSIDYNRDCACITTIENVNNDSINLVEAPPSWELIAPIIHSLTLIGNVANIDANDFDSGLESNPRWPSNHGGLMQFSLDSHNWSAVMPYAPSINIGFLIENPSEKVYVRVRDRDGNWSGSVGNILPPKNLRAIPVS